MIGYDLFSAPFFVFVTFACPGDLGPAVCARGWSLVFGVGSQADVAEAKPKPKIQHDTIQPYTYSRNKIKLAGWLAFCKRILDGLAEGVEAEGFAMKKC